VGTRHVRRPDRVAHRLLFRRVITPASDLANVHVDLLASYACFERIFAVLDRADALADEPGATPLERAAGRIEFRDVTFCYDGSGEAVSHRKARQSALSDPREERRKL
jgi:ABC-type bacteriocin/lantibiotic exporter with double-glycine peptidase domain